MLNQRLFKYACIIVSIIGVLAVTLYGAIDLKDAVVLDCGATNGIVTQYDSHDYLPPLPNDKWLNISYTYEVNNTSYYHNFIISPANSFDQRYYNRTYAPIGKVIPVGYTPSNISNSWCPGGCKNPTYHFYSTMLFIAFAIMLVLLIIGVSIFYIDNYHKRNTFESI